MQQIKWEKENLDAEVIEIMIIVYVCVCVMRRPEEKKTGRKTTPANLATSESRPFSMATPFPSKLLINHITTVVICNIYVSRDPLPQCCRFPVIYGSEGRSFRWASDAVAGDALGHSSRTLV